MNFESTRKDMRDQGGSGAWDGVKQWNRAYPRLSRVLWICLALLVVAGVVWLVYPPPQTRGFGGPGGPNNIQSVGVAQATIAPINVTLNSLGTVTPLATATVRPQVSGLLTNLYFTEGQMVKRGDPLAQIDPRPYQAALDQVKGQLARDQANLANAKTDLARYQSLAAQNAISNQQLSTQAALVRSDTGLVTADEANVETAEINLGYTRIVSPIPGRVGLHQVDVGNIVSSGQTTGIVVVTELSPISVTFTVPEDQISAVMARLNSGASLSVDASDRSQTVVLATGKLATVDNVVDVTTGTVKMRALFDNTDGKLFPNQFVNIKLLVDTLQNQIVIPVPAVQRGTDGPYVFVVSPDKTVSQRNVTLGIQDGQKVAITQGLKAGDTVVVDGADRLRDGAEVNIPKGGGRIVQPSVVPNNGAGGGRGGNPAQRAARLAAITKACSADLAKYCAGQDPRTATRCLFQNQSSLSSDCAKAVTAGRGNRGGGGGFGGGFGGGP
jgi:multidrug efflux system membrane fusion protein